MRCAISFASIIVLGLTASTCSAPVDFLRNENEIGRRALLSSAKSKPAPVAAPKPVVVAPSREAPAVVVPKPLVPPIAAPKPLAIVPPSKPPVAALEPPTAILPPQSPAIAPKALVSLPPNDVSATIPPKPVTGTLPPATSGDSCALPPPKGKGGKRGWEFERRGCIQSKPTDSGTFTLRTPTNAAFPVTPTGARLGTGANGEVFRFEESNVNVAKRFKAESASQNEITKETFFLADLNQLVASGKDNTGADWVVFPERGGEKLSTSTAFRTAMTTGTHAACLEFLNSRYNELGTAVVALQATSRLHLVHGDLNDGNIFWDTATFPASGPELIDFGNMFAPPGGIQTPPRIQITSYAEGLRGERLDPNLSVLEYAIARGRQNWPERGCVQTS